MEGKQVVVKTQEPACDHCRFFDPIVGRYDDKYGRCLRNPPQFIESGVLNGEWPVVRRSSWCGEHEEYYEDDA